MSSTNKTTNYNLSQFLGTDKPAWLGDYNADMLKIDTGIHTAATTATGADGKADANTTAIGTLANLTTTVKTDLVSAINEIDTEASTASNVASAAGTTATSAKNKADGLEAYLTLNNDTTVQFTTSTGTVDSSLNQIAIRTNATNSLGKFYGHVYVANIPTGTTSLTITSGDTGIRPTSAISFNGCALARVLNRNNDIYRDLLQSYTLNTNGTITATVNVSNCSQVSFYFLAVILFITNFGDIPE